MNQTIPLPSGAVITITVQESRPLSEWTDVEIAQQIEFQRTERRKVQYRKDEEAVQVRTSTQVEIKRLRAELARRHKEAIPCPVCGDLGYIGQAPNGEHCYCSGCRRGLELNLSYVAGKMDDFGEWLHGFKATHESGGVERVVSGVIGETVECLAKEFDEIKAKLEVFKRAR